MLNEVPTESLDRLRPLFSDFPGLHGCLDAALEGSMGTAYADDAEEPAVALVKLDFTLLAGDPSVDVAEEAVRNVERPASIVVSGPDWASLLRRVWGEKLQSRTRIAFSSEIWDRSQLDSFTRALPEGYSLKRVGAEDAGRFAQLADSFVYNFPSLDAFIAHGVGYGIEYEGRYVSGCSSFAISSRSLEFEIQTHPDFRRRGLAMATAAAMIEHCLDNNMEPCWDAHNDMSAALAKKLGFVDPTPYVAYGLPPPAES